MVFNATFTTIFQLYHGGQFYWWRKPEYPEKTTDLSKITDQKKWTWRTFKYSIPYKTMSVWLFLFLLVHWYISSFEKQIISCTKQTVHFITNMGPRKVENKQLSSLGFLNVENRVKQIRLNHAHMIFNYACHIWNDSLSYLGDWP